MKKSSDSKSKHVVIQQRIDESMTREFDKLLRENKQDILLNLLIDGKLDDMNLDELKRVLSGK